MMQDRDSAATVLAAEQRATAATSANRIKDEFLAMLGHELRNSLAPIRAALEVMRLHGTQSREQDIIERQVSHLTRQVDDLLDISRINGGKIELRKEPIELATVIAQAIEITGPLLVGRRHLLAVRVPAQGLVVDADPARLAQTFSNLLSNAAKYSDHEAPIIISAMRVGDKIRAEVRDHGVGIAPEMLDKVFELFVQQPQTLNLAQGGLGLGLAIVRSLVEIHGGTIAVHSAGRGHGSQFTIELPALDEGVATAVPTPVARATSAVGSRRILLIDDNPDAAEMMQSALDALGYTVMVAADGPEALRIAPGFLPSIALVDIGLPGMGGYELAHELRACAALPQLQLVALTGYGQASDFQRSAAAGFARHLVKPVDLYELDQLLKELGA